VALALSLDSLHPHCYIPPRSVESWCREIVVTDEYA
jgi:hypothetical protein